MLGMSIEYNKLRLRMHSRYEAYLTVRGRFGASLGGG
jgi:hypothetical protein